MKILLLMAAIAALAGCSGAQVEATAVTDCMIQCLDQQIKVTLDDGSVVMVSPSEFKKAIWDSETQTLTLKGYKLGKLKVQ